MMEFIMPCLFGLEGPLANELRHMGLPNVRSENGRVRFSGGFAEMATLLFQGQALRWKHILAFFLIICAVYLVFMK